MAQQHLAIVGAGAAGGSAAAALRTHGFEGRISLLGAEAHRPYLRPPLTKKLVRGAVEPDSVYLNDESWFRNNDIELRTSTTVTAVDAAARSLQLSSAERLPFDALLLATGSRTRRAVIEGSELAGVHYLLSIEDSVTLRDQLGSGDRQLVVIGSGWIGLELAASASALGNSVTVLGHSALPLESAVGPELGAFFARLHADNGVTIRSSVSVQAITGRDGFAAGVVLADGTTVPADIVLIAIGAEPNVELAEAAGIAVNNGILVNDRLESSVPGIFAAGDVARAVHPTTGVHLRNPHFSNALKSGAAAARNMLGHDLPFDELPGFMSEQHGVTFQFAGFATPGARVVFRGDPSSRSFSAFWIAAGRPVAGAHLNVADPAKALQQLIKRGQPVDVARLTDPTQPLEQL